MSLLAILPCNTEAQDRLFEALHQMLPVRVDATSALALGDVDGDGDRDLVVGNWGEPNRLYLNDGVGSFRDVSGTHLPLDTDETCALALGDVNGDGAPDLVVGNSGQPLRLYLNDGAGHFTEAKAGRPSAGGPASSLALGDVDGDGDRDLVVGTGASCHALPGGGYGCFPTQSRLYLNDGTGSFVDATATHLPQQGLVVLSLVMGDVEGDGDLDLVLGAGSSGGFQTRTAAAQDRLYLNDGAGRFTDATEAHMPEDAESTTCLALGDVDGDGAPDLLLGSDDGYGNGRIRFYRNKGRGPARVAHLGQASFPSHREAPMFSDATASHLPGAGATLALALVDVDGDGDPDLHTSDSLYLNDGTGFFTDATTTHGPVGEHYAKALGEGDVDGDGDSDLVAGISGPNRLYLNHGTGIFGDPAAAHVPRDTNGTQAMAMSDVDGDGDLDLFLGNDDWGGNRQNRLYLNEGGGAFRDATGSLLPSDSDYTQALVVGDVDGDGDPDVVFGNVGAYSGDQNRLYSNDGLGSFVDRTPTHLPVDAKETRALALGDVDGDGDPDLLLGNSGQDLMYLNDGTGIFSDATLNRLPPDTAYTQALALGDVDGDQDLDLVVGDGRGQDRLYLNDGSGVFTDGTATRLPPGPYATFALALGDVDGDVDLDLATGNDWQNYLFLNDGSGTFTDVTATHLPDHSSDRTRSIELCDADGDGDLDLLVGNGGGAASRLCLNDGLGVFSDVTATSMPTSPREAYALATGDVDGDGDLDLAFGIDNGQNVLLTNLTRQLAWRGIPRVGKPLVLDLYGEAGEAWILSLSQGVRPSTSAGARKSGTLAGPSGMFPVVAAGSLDSKGLSSATFQVPDDPALVGVILLWSARFGSLGEAFQFGRPCAECVVELATLTGM